jgi:hypothetical protein
MIARTLMTSRPDEDVAKLQTALIGHFPVQLAQEFRLFEAGANDPPKELCRGRA